jgi:hypothetical protein
MNTPAANAFAIRVSFARRPNHGASAAQAAPCSARASACPALVPPRQAALLPAPLHPAARSAIMAAGF